ncbi:hypothetical protein APHAL10511_004262 [Amanita phalloides]|nr:hypothetical protein APHAL10511_004262 [Amanita phalloides]
MNNLRAVLDNLKSDKVKERQEGLAAIRTIFTQDHVVANFHVDRDGKGDPRMWLSVFQALFTAVLTEKTACAKKSASNTAERRASEAAGVVRWLTERAVTVMNKRVAKALFDHLTQTLVCKGELFMPIALDYVKALKSLVSYTPHLEHLEEDMWVKLVEMGFNVVLGDPLTRSFWNDEMSIVEMQEDLYEEDGEDEILASPTKKRRYGREASELPRPSTSKPHKGWGRRIVSVSQHQIEFTSLLAILLRSPSAPVLSYCYNETDNNNHLASSVLDRLKRFLVLYPADSSLLHDFLSMLSPTLSHLALNKRHEVEDFARATWDALVGLWSVKDRRLKEGVVAVLRILFYYITTEELSPSRKPSGNCIDGIRHLWHLLDGEAESRRGVDGLAFDSLRLELCNAQDSADKMDHNALATKTFCAGWHFDVSQALSWAILELQADCASQLYDYSESMQTSVSGASSRNQAKRPRLQENPIKSLLSSIRTASHDTVRVYHLQAVLFIVERHWHTLHSYMREEIMNTLFHFISYEDGNVQSWVLLCMASVAYAEADQTPRKSHSLDSLLDPTIWDSVWSHAIRRVNVPSVSRAACHAAYVLLSLTAQSDGPTRLPLSNQRILSEIETLTKDIDVQGPLYPYDSVCKFLALCLKVASQDVRLYRMHLEEKVLTWFVDNWKMAGIGRGRMPLHQVVDILLLLENVCGFNRKSDFVSRFLLPDSLIVHTLVEEERIRVIRDFLLHARVPEFQESILNANEHASIDLPDVDLVQPQARERKISAFFQRSLELLNSEWESAQDDYTRLTAEVARRLLDFAVAALSFEALLICNGTHSDKRATQSAAKLVTSVTRALREAPWTVAEKALVSLGLEPLVFIEDDDETVPWQVMLSPNNGTGIKKHVIHRLTSHRIKRREQRRVKRMNFLRIIWQISDVQEQFLGDALAALRHVLYSLVGESPNEARPLSGRAANGKDDFDPISTHRSTGSLKRHDDELYLRHILHVCVGFLTVGPSLQSAAGETTRDRDLITFVLNCADKQPDNFLVVCPMLLSKIRQRILHLGEKTLNLMLDELSRLLQLYAFARSNRLQKFAIQVLHFTSDIWLAQSVAAGEVGDKIRQICDWLSGALRKKKINAWPARDAFAMFLDEYLEKDPGQNAWSVLDDNEDEEERAERSAGLPTALLMLMNSDEDIRVRFRTSTVIGRLFSATRRARYDPMLMYADLREHFTKNLDNFEHMLSRTLALGNIMIVSSEVRRGAYWHILETCFYVDRYNSHVEAVLKGVSERMGLAKFSRLFDVYASQLAYSICKMEADIHHLAPNLLGYRDRLECAQATFQSFAPSMIVQSPHLFEGHCAVLQKTVVEGIRESFGDIVGLLIIMWMAEPGYATNDLESYLREHTVMNDGEFNEALHLNVDRITTAVLKSLGDQNFSSNGPIIRALRDFDSTGGSALAFRALTHFRGAEDFHSPNLPAHPTPVILKALDWIAKRIPEAGSKATTYHIMQQILAELQSSPLINEQYRLINALTLWISLHHSDFNDLTLLHSLAHGATSMLAQSDLAQAAQSWLDWAFRRYIKKRVKDNRLSNILIRIACYANEHARNQDPALIQWIDEKIQGFDKSDQKTLFHSQIQRALPAWSHQPSPYVVELSSQIKAETLSKLLNDQCITTNKFRIVRRLLEEADCDESRFETRDFWRLKECIPPLNDLQTEDADAFAALLYLHKGRINSFNAKQATTESLRSFHLQDDIVDGQVKVRISIMRALWWMLDGDEASKVHLAYQTLRWIMSVMPEDLFALIKWPLEIKDELRFLQKYRRTPRKRPSRNLEELQNHSSFIDSACNFFQWISMFTILLADVLSSTDDFFAQLVPILETYADFAEEVLPVLVHRLLQNDANAEGLASQVLSGYFTKVLKLATSDISCIRVIVDVVLHLRYFSPSKNDALAFNKWLNISYTLLAQNALKCGAYTTALLFLELAFEFKNDGAKESWEEILYEIYSHIDEPDGFYGIKSYDLRRFLIKRFHHEKQWDKALRFHGAALEAGSREGFAAEGLLEAFHAFGFDQLAIDTLRGPSTLGNNVPTTSYMNYQLAWRTETWDLPERAETTSGAALYHAFRSIYRERDVETIDRIVRSSLLDQVSQLRPLGAENVAEIRKVTQDIMCLGQIFRWRSSDIQEQLASKRIDHTIWSDFTTMPEGFDFHDFESIMTTRLALVRSVRRKEERQQIGNMVTPFTQSLVDVEKRCLIRLSEAARHDGQIQIALNAVVRAQRLEKEATFNVSQEFANVLWLQKEEKPATEFLSSLLTEGNHVDTIGPSHRATLLAQLGAWTAEACLEKPTDICDRFFEPAIALLEQCADDYRTQATVFHQYAVFSDRQYHAILKSPDALRWKVYMQRKAQEIERRDQELRRTQSVSRQESLRVDQDRAMKLLREDSELFKKHTRARDSFLRQAIDMYSRCLKSSDEFDNEAMIRLCSLWFANFDDDADIQAEIGLALDRIPSRKVVFLAHQLTARLSKPLTGLWPKNQENLHRLVFRMCQEHPFHSLYQVYCLYPDRSASSSGRRLSGRHSMSQVQTERAAAAVDIFDKLRQDGMLSKVVRDVQVLCDACVEWAKYPIKNDHRFKGRPGTMYEVPKEAMLRNLSEVKVPVMTCRTAVDVSMRYDNCVWIQRYDTKFETAGGINLPKIMYCFGSDGRRYKQLFKGEGNDDLRQDAVMEQVFDLVNDVLGRERETRRRNLNIRGYKVIPLNAQAGVIEFVANTKPLRNLLITAHEKYHPDELKHSEILEEIVQIHKQRARMTAEMVVSRYVSVTERFQPVMRHLFTEMRRDPMSWFSMRLGYTRSVASSSIIGHVLGLGDRHTSNILMDSATGEVVHIDLGIAFGQGKLLPTPEDGGGVSAVRGGNAAGAEGTL